MEKFLVLVVLCFVARAVLVFGDLVARVLVLGLPVLSSSVSVERAWFPRGRSRLTNTSALVVARNQNERDFGALVSRAGLRENCGRRVRPQKHAGR